MVRYTVRASFPSGELVEAYVNWLTSGHVQQVLAGGAQGVEVIRLDAEVGPMQSVEVRYRFATRASLERYLKEFAPALRAEGLAKFGPSTGAAFVRTIGDVRFTL
jgi:hypothetical protein